MLDFGAKLAFARTNMVFSVDVEMIRRSQRTSSTSARGGAKAEIETKVGGDANASNENVNNENTVVEMVKPVDPEVLRSNARRKLEGYSYSGSFSFYSVMEDFVSGSRLNIDSTKYSFTKIFTFTGPDFMPFGPNLNPFFAPTATFEFTRKQSLSFDCFSISLRKDVGPLDFVAAVSLNTLPEIPFFTAGFVYRFNSIGLELASLVNDQRDVCFGLRQAIADSGVYLRLAFCVPSIRVDLKNGIEIGLEM